MGRAYLSYQPKRWLPGAPEPTLQQRLAEIEVIYDAAPIGIFLCDRQCRFIRVNPHLAEIDGLPAEQHVGKLVWDVVPALRRQLEPIFQRVLDFGETVHKLEVEGETPKAPGIKRYWEASCRPIYNENDEIVAISGIVDEITDRKAAEKERQNSEARLKRLLEANLFGVATATLEGITDANDAFLQIVGYSREDFLRQGIAWRQITPPEQLAKDKAAVETCKATGVCPASEKEYIRKDGRRVPVLFGATLLDHEPIRWIAFAIDLSERKASEEHTRQLLREMTHRSKNLIAVISAIAHQLAQTPGSSEDFNVRFSARLQALAGIHDILVRDDWRGAMVRELIRSQLAHCADLLGHRVLLQGPPVSLRATACQYLGMALHELGTNALKYGALSSETGSVTIRWSVQPAENPASFTIEWVEDGGPLVQEPTRQGFGHKVTTQFIAHALAAQVSEEFRKEGLRWSLVMPSTYLLSGTP